MPFNEHVLSNSLPLWFLSIYSYILYLSLKGFLIQDACSVLYINIRQSYPLCGYKDTSWFVKKMPHPRPQKYPWQHLLLGKFQTLRVSRWPRFCNHCNIAGSSQPAACRRWCLLRSTGGSGPSLLQKPCMPTLSLCLGIKGPGRWYLCSRAVCLTSSLHLSDVNALHLSDVNADVHYLHREGTQPLVDHTMCLHCWDLKVSLQLKRYFLPTSCKPSTFSSVPPQMRQQEGKGDFAANFILLLI